MAESKKSPKKAAAQAAGGEVNDAGTWTASEGSKKKATGLRIWAIVLWVLGLGAEIGAIFGLLLNENILTTKTSIDENGVLTTTPDAFPDWAFWTLIGLLVFDAIVVIIGSQLWKRANSYDPASKKEPVRFFVQNQLGAIISLIAFVPVIILIFLNKNMDKTQKGWAGGIAVVLGIVAVLFGISYSPPSVEQYTADRQAVIQLLGTDTVYWTTGGEVSHVCGTVSDLADSVVTSGTTAEAVEAGKPRLTLELESELEACGRAVPHNIDEIVDAIRAVRDGTIDVQILPTPDWTGVENAPTGGDLDQLNEVLDGLTASEG